MSRLHRLIMMLVFLTTTAKAGAGMDTALARALADVEAAADALVAEREVIASARRPLVDQVAERQREVAALRADVQRQRALRSQRDHERARRADELIRLEQEHRYLVALAQEYRRLTETRMHSSESEAARAALADVDTRLDESDPASFAAGLAGLLTGALERAGDRLGGHQMPAVALDAQGIEVKGSALLFGPLAYFHGTDGAPSGLMTTRFGSMLPAVETDAAGPDASRVLAALARGEEAVVPVDVTGGDALKVAAARTPFWMEWREGGLVMIPLLAAGLLAAVLAVWKAIDLRRLRVRDEATWRGIMEDLQREDVVAARAKAAAAPDPLGSLFAEGITCRNASREQLEELLHERIISFMPRIERHLGMLAVLGGIAPLLGLLGTVTGMIHTFQLVTLFGSGDAKLLSGGISEALITTKYGLVIAVPVLLAHAYLVRVARGRLALLEQTALGMVNDVKGRPVS